MSDTRVNSEAVTFVLIQQFADTSPNVWTFSSEQEARDHLRELSTLSARCGIDFDLLHLTATTPNDLALNWPSTSLSDDILLYGHNNAAEHVDRSLPDYRNGLSGIIEGDFNG